MVLICPHSLIFINLYRLWSNLQWAQNGQTASFQSVYYMYNRHRHDQLYHPWLGFDLKRCVFLDKRSVFLSKYTVSWMLSVLHAKRKTPHKKKLWLGRADNGFEVELGAEKANSFSANVDSLCRRLCRLISIHSVWMACCKKPATILRRRGALAVNDKLGVN